MREIVTVAAVVLGLLAFNLAWIGGGACVARRLNFHGKWAIYKGQMVIYLPLFFAVFAVLLWSGILQ